MQWARVKPWVVASGQYMLFYTGILPLWHDCKAGQPNKGIPNHTHKANKITIQILSLYQIDDWYTVQSVATEVKYSLQHLELRSCKAAFMSQGDLPRLPAVDTLVYDLGDTLPESHLEFGTILRTLPMLVTLQLSGRSMRSIENTTLPLTLHHLSMDYIILCDNAAELIAIQQGGNAWLSITHFALSAEVPSFSRLDGCRTDHSFDSISYEGHETQDQLGTTRLGFAPRLYTPICSGGSSFDSY